MGIFVELQKEARLRELELGRTLDESEVKQIRYNAVMREAAEDHWARREPPRAQVIDPSACYAVRRIGTKAISTL